MKGFQCGSSGVNGVLEAPNDLVVVRPRCVKGGRRWSLASAFRKILGVIEVLFHVAGFKGCGRYERFGDVGRCGDDKSSKRNVMTTAA